MDQMVALSHEVDSAASLLRHGQRILSEYRFASQDADPLFACLAGGTEKLLKLTYGLIVAEEKGAWPLRKIKRANHYIVRLDAMVRPLLVERESQSTAPGLIAHLLELSEDNSGLAQTLTTLERYALGGRFYNLDLLGGSEQPEVSPRELWDDLETAVLHANPELLEQLTGPEYGDARVSMNIILARSFGVWCELLLRSWKTGVCGGTAKQWSAQLDLGHIAPDGPLA